MATGLVKRGLWWFAAITVTAVLTGCAAAPDSEPVKRELFAMDTYMTLTAYGSSADKALDAAVTEIQRLDALWSVANPESEVYALNHSGSIEASADTLEILEKALAFYDITGGDFNPAILPAVRAWGVGTGEYRVPSDDELANLCGKLNADRISIDDKQISIVDGMGVDLGAIAKGYLSAKLMDIFREHGVSSGIVSLGGNVQALGGKPNGEAWNIAVQDPEDHELYACSLRITDSACITSGRYQRYFVKNGISYHHIIDPKTCKPANNELLSVTVVSPDGTAADALSTALFVKGLDSGIAFWQESSIEFSFIFITANNKIYISKELEPSFTLLNDKYAIITITHGE